jgi:uncharacterized membrane protein YphA (DoxX/SURF4 family)
MPNAQYRRFGVVLRSLSLGYGVLLFFSGLDKLLDLSQTEWFKFISPAVEYSLPISYSTLLLGMSIVQMIIGVMLILPRFAKLGAYLAALLLGLIAGNLFSSGFLFSRALLNAMLAIGMFVLGQLLAIKQQMRDSAS